MVRLRKLLLLGEHTCPWWFVHAFDNPARRLLQDPRAILGGLVEEGQTVVDVGCGAGFFSLALAGMVGPEGKVLGVDIQAKMLEMARRRARHRGLEGRIEFRLSEPARLGLQGPVDFVLAFWMVHEVPNQAGFLGEIKSILKPAGRLLLVEPKVHVSKARFEKTVELAGVSGFEVSPGPKVRFSRSALCAVKAPGVGQGP